MIIDTFLWMLLFIAGYSLIFFSADLFIDNLKDLCIIYDVSPFIIGLIVLGVDPEETIASVAAAINGLPFIAVGNVIGNSIISLTLCFALPALFHKIEFKGISPFYFLIILTCMAGILLSFFFNFGLFYAGMFALIMYGIYVFRSLRVISRQGEIDMVELDKLKMDNDLDGQNEEGVNGIKTSRKRKKILLVAIALLLIFLGGELLIISASNLIVITGISEAFFGFIIIAFVTNVEELTLVFKSIKKKSVEIGVGGMIGKIIWNLSLTFGLSGLIAMSIQFNMILIWNWILLLISIIYFFLVSYRKSIAWKDGIVLFSLFILFLVINFYSLSVIT